MKRLLVNLDANDCLHGYLNTLVDTHTSVREEDLYPFVDQYREAGATDLLISATTQYSLPQSRVLSDSLYKYAQKTENGVSVDYTARFHGIYTVYTKYGMDPYAVLFRRARETGLTVWMSLRMNDCHEPDAAACFLRPSFFYEAREKGWMIGAEYGYYRNCLNYAVPEVRRLWLDYIEEQLAKYPVDGLELDFQREIHCFDYLHTPDCASIMTEFIRQIRAITERFASLRGRRLRLGIRLGRDIVKNRIFGFDAEALCRDRLVDSIVVTPRWRTNDSDMPIREWKSRFPDTEIFAGLETNIACRSNLYQADEAAARGYSNRYLSDGADGMYFFNYYPVSGYPLPERSRTIFRTCGSPEAMAGLPMSYVVTNEDLVPAGTSAYQPLPISLSGQAVTLPLHVGRLTCSRKVVLCVGMQDIAPGQLRLSVNGQAVSCWEPCLPKPLLPTEGLAEVPDPSRFYAAQIETVPDGSYSLAFSGCGGQITYLELEMDP